MIRLLTAAAQIALVVAAMAMSIPAITFAQTPESATGSVPVEAEVAEVTSGLAGDEASTDKDTSVQAEQAGAVEAEIQRRINEPQDWLSSLESWSTIIRNFGLLIVAVIALPLAIWRSIVAARQATTAQRGLLNERYQKGAEMLGSKTPPVRLGGIYALARQAREQPEDYHTQIMRILCAFVRHPPEVEEVGKEHQVTNKLSEDVLVIVKALRERNEAQIEIEKKEKYCLGLAGTDLCGVYLSKANLSSAYLVEANLNRALLGEANLSMAHLAGAKLISAMLSQAKLTGADLSDADMSNCEGLTQEQIDRTIVFKDLLPNLTGAVDANTGKPLVWSGRSITGQLGQERGHDKGPGD